MKPAVSMALAILSRLLVAVVLIAPCAVRAQPRWTLGPSLSFGYGWTDGQYDYVGDDVYPTPRACPSEGDGGGPILPVVPFTACDAPFGAVAAYGGIGVSLVGVVTDRVAWASSLDLTIGGTHLVGDDSNAGVVILVRPRDTPSHYPDSTFAPDVDVAYRFASTARLRLGTGRRGYLGVGARVGYRMQVGTGKAVWFRVLFDPARQEGHHLPRGFTLEALLEGGILLDHVSLGIIGGAGRPRFRAELVLTVPFAIGAR